MFKFGIRRSTQAFANAGSLRTIGRRNLSTRLFTSSRFSTKASISLLTAGASLGLLYSQSIALDSSKDISLEESVSVDSGIDAFPTTIPKTAQNLHQTDYQLIGFGVRSVTFVGFKVYGIGLYIASDDIKKAKHVFRTNTEEHKKTLVELLEDPVLSQEVIEHLLADGVRLMARINPIRNTDYNHMRDGLVKSILAHGESKIHREEVGEGLDQLRSVFSKHRGSVPKNHLLFLEVLPQGKLGVVYENTVTKKSIVMGEVSEPQISRVLMLSYLSGKKPLSEPLRKSCVEGLNRL